MIPAILYWAYLWIIFLALTNVIQFFTHWYFHHRGTEYERGDDE